MAIRSNLFRRARAQIRVAQHSAENFWRLALPPLSGLRRLLRQQHVDSTGWHRFAKKAGKEVQVVFVFYAFHDGYRLDKGDLR